MTGVGGGLAVGGSAAVASVLMLWRSILGPLSSSVAGAILAGLIGGEVPILNQPVEPAGIEVIFFGQLFTRAGRLPGTALLRLHSVTARIRESWRGCSAGCRRETGLW